MAGPIPRWDTPACPGAGQRGRMARACRGMAGAARQMCRCRSTSRRRRQPTLTGRNRSTRRRRRTDVQEALHRHGQHVVWDGQRRLVAEVGCMAAAPCFTAAAQPVGCITYRHDWGSRVMTLRSLLATATLAVLGLLSCSSTRAGAPGLAGPPQGGFAHKLCTEAPVELRLPPGGRPTRGCVVTFTQSVSDPMIIDELGTDHVERRYLLY